MLLWLLLMHYIFLPQPSSVNQGFHGFLQLHPEKRWFIRHTGAGRYSAPLFNRVPACAGTTKPV